MDSTRHNKTPTDIMKSLSSQDFMDFGLNHIAYVRPVQIDGGMAYSVFAADGTPISVHEDEAAALAAMRLDEMRPVRVH